MDPISISIGTVLAGIPVIITATIGLLAIIRALKKPEAPKDFSGAIDQLNKDLVRLEKDITELQSMLNGKTNTQIESINNQIADFKTNLSKFQDKLEKLTDLIIRHFSNRL